MKTDDLSPLAWVQDELRRSLEAAHKALRRYVKDSDAQQDSDVDAVDPAVLRGAKQQLHQGVGALELVGLSGAAVLLRASEGAVQRFLARPQSKLATAQVEVIEGASYALLEYLSRLLSGKPVSPVAMFPQYRDVQELAGADRVHPADLWTHDWRWRDLPEDDSAFARLADATSHDELESHLLLHMRKGTPETAAALSDLFAGFGAASGDAHTAILWRLGAGLYEGLAHGLLKADKYSKRVGSRLLAQLRMIEHGETTASERLAQDLLFFCAQCESPGDGRHAPRLAAVRQVYGLAHLEPVDYEVARLGRFDPAWVAQARKRVAAAKDAWSSVAGGETHRIAGLAEQFSLIGDSIRRLYPSGEALADELTRAIAQTVQNATAPAPALAMEVATSVLYLEASLEDGDFDHPQMASRVQRLARRISAVRSGLAAEPLEGWMEELYRRVSERQTLGSVVQELRLSLADAEKHIDQFFRNPSERTVLIPVPNRLASMRGVLSVLGMEQASGAVLRMRDDVDQMIAGEQASSSQHSFERLARNMGALGFLIDMLSVQPNMAKSLFVFDAKAGTLSLVMGQEQANSSGAESAAARPVAPRLIEQAQSLAVSAIREDVPVLDVARDLERLSQEALVADQPILAATVAAAQAALEQAADAVDEVAAREQIALVMNDFVVTASGPIALEPEPASRTIVAPPVVPSSTGFEEDLEMRAIFLEEAREVLESGRAALADLAAAPAAVDLMTTLRRAFHTLKGSSRMVGLKDFGEAAWSCEQLFNARLADAPQADESLLTFCGQVLSYLGDWVEHIASGEPADHDGSAVRAAADALRLDNHLRPLLIPSRAEPIEPLPLIDLPTDLPSVRDLDLEKSKEVTGTEAAAKLSFELSLLLLDAETRAEVAGVTDSPTDLPGAQFESETADDDHQATVPLPLLDDVPSRPSVLAEEVETIDLEFGAQVPDQELIGSTPGHAELAVAGETAKQVGPLSIAIPLFNIYLNEADELSRRLATELSEWALELHRSVGEDAIAYAHSLAGSSATVGYTELSQLARALEHALARSQTIGSGTNEEGRLYVDTAEEIRRLLHQFAAGFLKSPAPELLRRLADNEMSSVARLRTSSDAAAGPLEVQAADSPAARGGTFSEAIRSPEHEFDEGAAASTPTDELTSAFGALGQIELKTFAAIAEGRAAPVRADALDADDDIDAVDAVDAELFPIFSEEAEELLPQLASRVRDWMRRPSDASLASACMRSLHTLKGGARLAGAMRLGEMAHRMETAIEHLLVRPNVEPHEVEALQARSDALSAIFEALAKRDAKTHDDAMVVVSEPPVQVRREMDEPLHPPKLEALPVMFEPAQLRAIETDSGLSAAPVVAAGATEIDWSRFPKTAPTVRADGADRRRSAASASAVRVRAQLLDRLVNQAGEVSITRSRIESEVALLKSSLTDLTDNLERLRGQLREIELQAETQMSSRMEAAKVAAETFDPLEFDRFTRFQELTRMMAESVNDVATVQRTLQRTLEATEDELAAQARLTRELQDDLLRTRMVEFEGLSDRLYRVVRQAAKETGKQVRLDIVGGSIEVDRGVLDRMTGAFEHLLRNSVTHGIEGPSQRAAAGKDSTGTIVVALTQEGNEVGVEFRDDGQGLNLPLIREKGIAMGLLDGRAAQSDAELANLIFTPGFTTAEAVTELAGRGIGMDVVRSEVNAMGGRIETATAAGQGSSFRLVLPLTTAVTQVVMLRCGDATIAVPATLVEIVRRATPSDLDRAYVSGSYNVGDGALPFFWLGALLQLGARGLEAGRTLPVVVVKSAQQRIVVHVDEVLGAQEVVVKNLGPQLSRMPGLAGMTLLASGQPALIYNPVALATMYGASARAATLASLAAPDVVAPVYQQPTPSAAPLILVVDDSLTVRRVTQRLLVREGYRVVLAKDGLEALERVAEEKPSVVLSDIEMPRMDGFDLVRNLRGDARWRELPVIMITSRIAEKHREHAAELGVDHYLGKPYSEEDLLALIGRYVGVEANA